MLGRIMISIILLWTSSVVAQEAPQTGQLQSSAAVALEGQVINAKGGRIQVRLKNGGPRWFSIDSSALPSEVIGKTIRGKYVPLGDTFLILDTSFLSP